MVAEEVETSEGRKKKMSAEAVTPAGALFLFSSNLTSATQRMN